MTKHGFPESNYTPNGYIDNPYHTRNLHPSGVLRTSHRIGIGWWYPTGRIDDGDNLGAEYVSNLLLAFGVGGCVVATRDDCGPGLSSRYHSKNILSYDLEIDGVAVSAAFYLVGENSLLCRLRATSSKARKLTVHATNHYQMIRRKWWGSDGIAGYPAQDAIVQTIWAYGDQFALGSSARSVGVGFAKSEEEWLAQVRGGALVNGEGLSARRAEPLFGTLAYELDLAPGESRTLTLCLARGVNSREALSALREGLKSADRVWKQRIAEDDAFWGACPMPVGDWPVHWKHGWVYDFETQRMNSRPPIGIYRHRWDAMQVHEPRVVLAETAIDALTLSYPDMAVAQEELFGVFADAPYPNVPCTREDGSMNMIAADGAECGTAPSWCFPFHVIHSVYCRARDKEWLARLYPRLCNYIEWWIANRTDSDGWFHCKCSWESGQDGSKRFRIEGNEGAVSEDVRTVDVEASVAEALGNLADYALELDRTKDAAKWAALARDRVERTRGMFVDDWFRDFDAHTGEPIVLGDYTDIMMLAPVTCGIATDEQTRALAPKFEHFVANQRYWLEWPSFVFPFSEAACYAGHRELIANALWEIADRLYRRIDAREPEMRPDEHGRPAYTVPGVAHEFWPIASGLQAGSENYGWGASMPMNLIRSLIGFRESMDFRESAFEIAPTLPKQLLAAGGTYGMTNLSYRGVVFDVRCNVLPSGRLAVEVSYRSSKPLEVTVSNALDPSIVFDKRGKRGTLKLEGINGSVYRFRIAAG